MKKSVLIAAVAAFALCAEGRQFEVASWRGETVAALVPDYAVPDMDLKCLPKGVTGRIGTLRSVRYMTSPGSLKYMESADRVEWNSSSSGPRVVELTVSPDVPAATYDIGPMKLRVVDRVLPPVKEWKYYLDIWQHPWAVARVNGVKPFSPEHFKAMRPLWELLAAAGQKSLTVSMLEQPWDHQCFDAYHTLIGRKLGKDGKWEYDYTLFDKYVEFGRSCSIGPDISCYTMCPWGYIVRYNDSDGKLVSVKAKPGTKEFDDFWGPFLVDFADHLKEKGWFKDTYIAMDERTPEDVLYIVNFVRKHAPGLRIAMAGNRKPSDFKGISIDNYSQQLTYITSEFIAETVSRRADGYVTTHYVCCNPTYPNTFMTSGNAEAFWNGVYPAIAGLDGFLRWAWNSWGEDPVNDASYWGWRAGDTFLVYPDGSPSWRFLDLRNGIVAAEKLRILKQAGLYQAEIARLAKRFDVKQAVANKCNFQAIRAETLNVVNRSR